MIGMQKEGFAQTLVEEMKKEKTAPGSVGHCGELDCPAPFQKRNRVQKQPARGSVSELAAKSVFRFFHSAWEVSQ
ncbi:hypothetical protein P4J62_29405, partial [Bacillus cereus]|nr:hypothetical protein [Bacillus cereus]